MKNNPTTELREEFYKNWIKIEEGYPPSQAERIADWWLAKIEELTKKPEHTCGRSIEGKKTCPVCNPMSTPLSTSPDVIVKEDSLEELIEQCGNRFISLRRVIQHKDMWICTFRGHVENLLPTGGRTPKEAVANLLKALKQP